MTAHEERLEQEKQDGEAKAEEGRWTVVVHHKGRKKTTETEFGTTVGSFSQAALENKTAKKKQSEPVAHGVYRFQSREAQRNDSKMALSESSTISSNIDVNVRATIISEDEEDSQATIAQREVTLLDIYCGCGAISIGLCMGAHLAGLNLVT